jgi:ABC-type multidrug transport system fused ATPase/permease subunit
MGHYWVIGCILAILSLIVLVLYPVVMWKIYTSYSISSALATLTLFKWTLVWGFVSNIGILFPMIFVPFISEKLDENTRTRSLISFIVWLLPSAFYFALILWLFGAGTDYSLAIGITSLSLSPILVVIFMFLLVVYLVPYLWGWKRATKWRQGLLQKQRDWVEKTLGILESTNSSRYTSELEELQAQISNEAKEFIEGDHMVQLWLKAQTERNDVSEAMRPIIREVEQDEMLEIMDSSIIGELQHADDPRFSYFESLANLSKEVEEIIKQLSGSLSETDKLRKAGCYSDKYRSEKEDIATKIATEKQTMPRFVTGFGFVFAAAGAAVVINEASKYILEMLRVSIEM